MRASICPLQIMQLLELTGHLWEKQTLLGSMESPGQKGSLWVGWSPLGRMEPSGGTSVWEHSGAFYHSITPKRLILLSRLRTSNCEFLWQIFCLTIIITIVSSEEFRISRQKNNSDTSSHFLMWSWASYLTFLSMSFLIYQLRLMIFVLCLYELG